MFGYFLVTAIFFSLSFTHGFSGKHQQRLRLKNGLKKPYLKFLIFLKISKIDQICISRNLFAYILTIVLSLYFHYADLNLQMIFHLMKDFIHLNLFSFIIYHRNFKKIIYQIVSPYYFCA